MKPSSDRDLQAYLDRSREESAPEASFGTEERRHLEAYRLLYRALETEPEGALPPAFAEAVVQTAWRNARPAQTDQVGWAARWLGRAVLPLTLTGMVIALLAVAAFALPGSLNVLLESLQTAFAPLQRAWAQAPLGLILAAVLALALADLADRFIGPEHIRNEC